MSNIFIYKNYFQFLLPMSLEYAEQVSIFKDVIMSWLYVRTPPSFLSLQGWKVSPLGLSSTLRWPRLKAKQQITVFHNYMGILLTIEWVRILGLLAVLYSFSIFTMMNKSTKDYKEFLWPLVKLEVGPFCGSQMKKV